MIRIMHIPEFICFVLGFILILGICQTLAGNLCPNTSPNYITPNTTYEANLKSLLPNLSSHANRQNGFYNFTAGDQDAVYGLFMCRGDVSAADCGACVSNASATALQICPKETTATIWYDLCTLRYSDEPVYGIPYPSFAPFYLHSGDNDSQPESFMGSVNKTLTQVAVRVVNDQSSDKKFATQEAKFNVSEKIYALAQCRPDISDLDGRKCLNSAIQELQSCCYSAVGARALTPDCNIRYETYLFYNSTANGASVPPPPPQPAIPPPSPPPNTTTTPVTTTENRGSSSSKVIIAIVAPIIGIVILLNAIFCFLRIRNAKKRHTKLQKTDVTGAEESSQYDFAVIQAITNNFSPERKIGQGGYGSVYKGILPNRQEVAVKRLLKGSRQGAQEFKNEVEVVVKFQHRNLVRLLGYCSHGEEKILIYEFVLNKSLDYFLFYADKQYLLDWPRRYKIIRGIARGLLYLHEDSRLKIIHRDLKTSNILLDANMDPKIADFGLARIVEIDQIEGNTKKIVGTYGYMSPEYAMHGEFSVKSDIFSLGVILLEIITGKKNRNISKANTTVDLLGYAWEYWRDDTPLEILDPVLVESYNVNEVIQCIHISLLCVQEVAVERPIMTEVMLMLSSYSSNRKSVPREPAFYHGEREAILKEPESEQPVSLNEVSISEFHPR